MTTATHEESTQTLTHTARAEEKNERVSSALADAKQRVEKHLQAMLQARTKGDNKDDKEDKGDDKGACEPLLSAMHEGLLAGGKRVRPFLLFASAALAETVSAQQGKKRTTAQATAQATLVEDAAAALEMIHSYSLIHDDLPAMDNDLLRRGQPTLHVKVGCGQAILAGDALLTLAFEVLAACDKPSPSETRVRLSLCFQLARAAGAQGMAGGQSWDLESEQKPERHAIREIHALKTGALLCAACAMGACCFDADEKLQGALRAYASDLGNAYQTIDDLRDEARDRKRREQKGATPSLRSRVKRETMGEEAVFLCRRAERALAGYLKTGGEPAKLLCAFARFLPTRIPSEVLAEMQRETPQEAA